MKTSMLVAAILAGTLSAPIVSAEEKSAPAKPAMSMDMGKPTPQMQENTQAMQENMKMMRGMGGPMMKGGKEHAGMKTGDKKGALMDADMMKHHSMMEQRVDMMQMMMEQMMQHDQALESTPAK